MMAVTDQVEALPVVSTSLAGAEGRTTPATDQDVEYCYRLLLGREPNAPDRRRWSEVLRRDRPAFAEVRRMFVNSIEYQTNIVAQYAALERLGAHPHLVELPEFKVFVRLNDLLVGAAIATHKEWEPHVQRELSPLLRPGGCFVDVGANVGYFTLLAASRVGPGGRVVAFEPNPDNRHLLGQSLTANTFSNVTIHPFAVADREAVMWLHRGKFNSLCWFTPEPTDRESVEVRVVVLDDVLSDLSRIDVIKIDTDGAEPLILRGARELLRRHRPVIFLEYAPANYPAVSRAGVEEPLDELRGLGYDLYLLTAGGPSGPRDNSEIVAAARERHIDLMARPR
jgi:FkbM family methyltransferase